MPKKPELSFEAKQIIWDIAATYSSRNYSAILRDVEKKFEELRKEGKLFEDTPDLRTLKNIIEIDIEELPLETVVEKLSKHVWHLRKDYKSILHFAKGKDTYHFKNAENNVLPSKAKVKRQFLEDHYKVLSTTALSIADLVHYVGADIGEQTISQIVDKLGTWQGGDPPAGQLEQFDELSDLLSSTEAKWLLSHIKSEAPALFIHYMYTRPKYLKSVPYKKPKSKNIDRWEDMTQDDVYAYGERLIDLL